MNRRIDQSIALQGCALVALAATMTPGALAQPAPAQVITVTNLADSGPGSLRQAIAAANAGHGGEIRFANGIGGAIVLTSGELRIAANVAIIGPGADTLTISGNNVSRVFTIESAPGSGSDVVTISGLTITGGCAGDRSVPPGKGGAIYLQGAALTLSRVTIANNLAGGAAGVGGEAAGGGVYAAGGLLTILDSTISGNQAMGNDTIAINGVGMGGGMAMDGGQLTLTRNSILGNQAIGGSALGGAIAFLGDSGGDTLTVEDSGISGNQAQATVIGGNALGGGLFVAGKTAHISAVIRRTRIVGNIAERSISPSLAGSTGSAGGSGGSNLGGGLYIGNLASVILAQVQVSGNTSDTYSGSTRSNQGVIVEGGGAYVGAGGALILNETTVILNAALPNAPAGASTGGGVFVASGGALDLDGSSKVEQNFARNFDNVFRLGGNP
jgi:hypothetical protein